MNSIILNLSDKEVHKLMILMTLMCNHSNIVPHHLVLSPLNYISGHLLCSYKKVFLK